MDGHDDDSLWWDDEREKIERETIADFKDSRIHVIKSFMEDAQAQLGSFGDDEIADGKRALGLTPPDTVATVAHAFRVMETFGKVVPRDAIVRVMMDPISHLFETLPNPRYVLNDQYVGKLRDAVLSDFWMDSDLVALFTAFFSKGRVEMRNQTMHGSYKPSVAEAAATLEAAEMAYDGVKKLIGPHLPSNEDPGY